MTSELRLAEAPVSAVEIRQRIDSIDMMRGLVML